ncbi:hypothetical protein HDG37_007490 [Paraburkholderia sp. MM5384-R2]|nr:hypothetical protein [Paraburkholderia sp. MM5384-R2]
MGENLDAAAAAHGWLAGDVLEVDPDTKPLCFDEPNVFVCVSGHRIQHAFCVKIRFSVRCTEPSRLKMLGEMKRL